MKKLTTIIALMLITISASAQLTEGRRPFAFLGSSADPMNNYALSFEAGVWGTAKATSYSITYDRMVSSTGTGSNWVGIKPYFTIFDNGEISYMLYTSPKINVESGERMIEFGFNPNYTVSNNLLFGVTLGNQVTPTGQWNMFLGVGFVILK